MGTPVSTRRAVLGGAAVASLALAAPTIAVATPSRSEWDQRLHEYRCADALTKAANLFSPSVEAMNEHEMLRYDLGIPKYGRSADLYTAAGEKLRRSNAHLDALLEHNMVAYYNPAERAAIALLMTPAPDLAAFHAKAEAAKEYDLDGLRGTPRPVFDVLLEDMARISGEKA